MVRVTLRPPSDWTWFDSMARPDDDAAIGAGPGGRSGRAPQKEMEYDGMPAS